MLTNLRSKVRFLYVADNFFSKLFRRILEKNAEDPDHWNTIREALKEAVQKEANVQSVMAEFGKEKRPKQNDRKPFEQASKCHEGITWDVPNFVESSIGRTYAKGSNPFHNGNE